MATRDPLPVLHLSIDMRVPLREVSRVLQLLRSVGGPIQAKRGCRTCRLELDTAEPGLVHYREEWDEEAFPRHVRSEEFRRVLFAMDLCVEEPRIMVGDLVGREGLAYLRTLREEVRPQG